MTSGFYCLPSFKTDFKVDGVCLGRNNRGGVFRVGGGDIRVLLSSFIQGRFQG